MYITKEDGEEIEVEIDEFGDDDVLRYARDLIEDDRSKIEYFKDLMEPEFKFDFLNDLYNIEYKKNYFESFPEHKKLIDFIKDLYNLEYKKDYFESFPDYKKIN
ncbi:hypothetical phage protein [Campylobacter phage CP220]|uniref:Hypothetical phage protein n=1 Tax=Campylobacter phage CP220 TaxID=2994044 RepID=D5GVF8_9CAUD|nr:hypothetical protein APL47_gp154 [Campylobacter phage CP220]CBJ93975.1 hypothetical phage protein [Campylobacter phage CP220]